MIAITAIGVVAIGSAIDIMTGTMIGTGMVGGDHAGAVIRHAADAEDQRQQQRQMGTGAAAGGRRHVDEAAVTASARRSVSL
ncbi:hypothetical protein ACNJX9_33880 [Bradyrhizobium sp. DASA03076]|uniref:hypothetical protein n=1 Tax=Bradyrhizobium sp. BLXBL-03 TaxID=3395916 RepID=UPI003F7308F0